MLVIIDYQAGNLRSVQRACQKVGMDADISSDPDYVRKADRIIFPGVGAAGSAMRSLRKNGVDEALKDVLREGKPVFGICLGLQISLEHSEENNQETLGIVPGRVRRFHLANRSLKVPHMGWNSVEIKRPLYMLEGVQSNDEFYFVHSYYPEPGKEENIFGVTEYESRFASVVAKDNYFATQFHPEKSGRAGLRMFSRFSNWNGQC